MSVTYLTHMFIVYCLFATVSFAWLPPDRCKQAKTVFERSIYTCTSVSNAPVLNIHDNKVNIHEVASRQNSRVNEAYKNVSFERVPAFVKYNGTCKVAFDCSEPYEMYTGDDCKFHTHDPRPIASVYCSANATCNLLHSVSTIDTYTATEGYTWNVKVSTKVSVIPDFLEIGAEVAVGGTYSCTYTKGRTVTDTVNCGVGARNSASNLNLYHVHTDMICKIGYVLVQRGRPVEISCITIQVPYSVGEEIREGVLHLLGFPNRALLDPNKISESTLQIILRDCPEYNIDTDPVAFWACYKADCLRVSYYEASHEMPNGKDTIVPFTNGDGDSEYEYACMVDNA